VFAGCVTGVVTGVAAGADVSLKESFGYAPGRLGGQGGWSEFPQGPSGGEVVAGSLSFGNVLTKGGKLLLPAGTNTQTAIPYSVDWDVDGSLMIGFMVREVDFANMGAFFNFGLGNRDTAATELVGRGGIGSTERFVMNWTGDLDTDDNAYTLAATVFIVMKITTAAGDGADRIKLEFYDTPDADGGIAGARPAATLTQSQPTRGTTSHLVFVAGSNVAVCMIDEIRIGKTIAEVAPVNPSRKRGTARTERDRNDQPKSIIYNDCGWTTCMRYPQSAPMSRDDVARATVGPLVGSRVRVYQFCLLGGHVVNLDSALVPRAPVDANSIGSAHLWRTHKTLEHLKGLDADPLRILGEACRKHGTAFHVSIRISGSDPAYKRSPWFSTHLSVLLESGDLDYAQADAASFHRAQVREILDRYDVDGVDLDFAGFVPSFERGQYAKVAGNIVELVRSLRKMTRSSGKTLSARFDVEPNRCFAAGLDVETMLAEGLFDQISLGAPGDQTPDARVDWWTTRAGQTDCRVFPAIETLPHPVPNPIYGGRGVHPSTGMVKWGWGRPSMAYMRAVAANAYAHGADGVTVFNSAVADGPFDRAAFTELADRQALAFADKQYVASVWGFRPRIYFDFWTSRFSMTPNQNSATCAVHVADDFAAATRTSKRPRAVLTLDLRGINRVSDVEVSVNGKPVQWNGYEYNHWDHGYWDDILEFDVPISALRQGENMIQIERKRENEGFAGTVEARKCFLEILYPGSQPDPAELEVRRRLKSDEWFAPGRIEPVGVQPSGCPRRLKPGLQQTRSARVSDPAETPDRRSPSLPKTIVYNDDGWSSYMRYPAPQTPDDIAETILGPVIGTGVTVYQFCALGGHAVNYNSSFLPRVGEMMDQVDSMHVWRMRETLRYLEEKHGTDPLHIMAKACREHGIACQFSLRMNDAHHTYRRGGGWYFPELQSPWFDEHKDASLPNYTLDYAHPDVHAYRKRQIQEILDNYDVTGIDLDFTRFAPWFRNGQEQAGMPKMTQLVQDLRAMTKAKGKTLSARFEYDPHHCIATGLDLQTMLAERLFDQITLGVTGSHVPDAPIDWWVEHTRGTTCKLCPGMEGVLHWIPAPGGGGTGTLPAIDGVEDDYGPPSMAYMRAVASVQYMTGADGISLFNFTCTDGPFDRAAFTELADPEAMKFKDKQYVARVWYKPFRMTASQQSASYTLRLADDFQAASGLGRTPSAVLTLSLRGIGQIDDIEVRINDTPLDFNGYHYNQSDHGSFSDVLKYDVPESALRHGDNTVELLRAKGNSGFAGDVGVRKLILDVEYQ